MFNLPLVVGRTVVHPHHGPATVTRLFSRKLRGEKVKYAELAVGIVPPLVIAAPIGSLEEIGVRDVVTRKQLNKLADVLSGPGDKLSSVWSARIKALGSKLATGDLANVAEVARDLLRRREERAISLAEKEILRDALRPLVAEVAVAVDVSEEEAERRITALVLTGAKEGLEVVPAA